MDVAVTLELNTLAGEGAIVTSFEVPMAHENVFFVVFEGDAQSSDLNAVAEWRPLLYFTKMVGFLLHRDIIDDGFAAQ